jgi:cyclophilin family peptidyl-prolyl cis-trans isomerase
MNRHNLSWIAVLLAALAGAAMAAATSPTASTPASPVKASLELNQQFYYVGDPMQVRITITNTGDAEVANPIKGGLIPPFQVLDADGKPLKSQSGAGSTEPQRPSKLSGKSGYFAIVDLSQPYPALKSRGVFTLRWKSDTLTADDIVVHIIPKFDPAKEYTARFETEEGAFVVDLMKKTAPIAVKAFVDMANAGFYDGLKIHEVRADQLVDGGDPTGTGGGQGPIRYPAELSAIPVVAGTVVMKPAGLAPPANASQFAISLKPEPRWTGQFTVLGQVVEGLDVVKRISNLASTDKPNYRPVTDIHTKHIVIVEKAGASATSTSGS